jgi:predicted Ser/Thr protein kinase
MSDTLAATPGVTATEAGASGELDAMGAGDAVGRHQIVSVLGAGGMGRVYRARDPDLNRDVAIKVLHRAPGSGSGGLEHRLMREAQAMAKLNHPNLATVYDVGTVRGEVYIAFEFIDGMTLGKWMREPGRTVAEKLEALRAAGRGLAAAHSAGVIHRDFKPDNVLVAKDGSVKVVDFGLARGVGAEVKAEPKAGDSDALSVDLTLTGSILGTPAYMAPEQHKGMAADERADQFGFAVSAWEALYGERPFKGKTIQMVAMAICDGAIAEPPAAAAAEVPAAIQAALRRALSVDPAERFVDMNALLAALTGAPAGTSGRRRRLMMVAAAAVVLVGIGVGLVLWKRGRGGEKIEFGGHLEGTQIRDTIFANLGEAKDCYAKAMVTDTSLGAGKVAIRFVIAPTGRVKSTAIESDSFDGAHGIAACIAAASMSWKFPEPSGSGHVEVVYPFEFRPIDSEIAKTGDGTYTIGQSMWDEWMKAPSKLTSGVKLVPTEKDGKQIGYKMFAIKEGSIAQHLGFEDGDTITRVGDVDLVSAVAAVKLSFGLAKLKELRIELTRRTVPRTHVYTIK